MILRRRALLLALLPAAVDASEAERDAFIAAHLARYREEVCGTHWVGNPSFAACMAMLRREAEAEWERRRALAAQPARTSPNRPAR
ncbi:MAG: hypothetical protein NZM27_01875 [Acetobacteraceae bacterium]|nr:hypothetical protein [Acetobacteraceae bacterium]MDW8397000.1 hypothetical protein [Acetobacteraceae bacterium]